MHTEKRQHFHKKKYFHKHRNTVIHKANLHSLKTKVDQMNLFHRIQFVLKKWYSVQILVSIHTSFIKKHPQTLFFFLKIDMLRNNDQKCEICATPWTTSFLNNKRYSPVLTSSYQKRPSLITRLCILPMTLN